MLLVAGVAAAHAQRPITGHVFSALDKRPITGASVTVVSTGMIAVTNDKGAFTVLGGNGPVALLVRAIAFKPKTAPVQLTGSAVDVTLEPDVFTLQAVDVTGQATAGAQRNLPHAVSPPAPAPPPRAPPPTPERALPGQLPATLT